MRTTAGVHRTEWQPGCGKAQQTHRDSVSLHIRERVESGEVKLVHVPTEHQYADLLTKSLARVKVERLRQQLHGYGFD
jgi:hypothetical protein